MRDLHVIFEVLCACLILRVIALFSRVSVLDLNINLMKSSIMKSSKTINCMIMVCTAWLLALTAKKHQDKAYI